MKPTGPGRPDALWGTSDLAMVLHDPSLGAGPVCPRGQACSRKHPCPSLGRLEEGKGVPPSEPGDLHMISSPTQVPRN